MYSMSMSTLTQTTDCFNPSYKHQLPDLHDEYTLHTTLTIPETVRLNVCQSDCTMCLHWVDKTDSLFHNI